MPRPSPCLLLPLVDDALAAGNFNADLHTRGYRAGVSAARARRASLFGQVAADLLPGEEGEGSCMG
jgi:hypothetical protein